ncbi:MAG: DNA-directed RNA polymerase [Polyangiaceae bacterium]
MRLPNLKTLLAASLAAVAVFTGGCASYVPFTAELQTEHHLVAKDIKNLQFYTSHEIRLRRELTSDSRQITGAHKLLVIAGKQIEEVVIAKHTPGVIVDVGKGTLKVSFEEGSSLDFALRGAVPNQPLNEAFVVDKFATGPDPFPGEHQPPPKNPDPFSFSGLSGDYYLLPDGGRTLEYKGQIYEAVSDSALAHLVISTDSLEEQQESETVLKGRQL